MAPTFQRIVRPGAFGPGLDAFAKIVFKDGKLSISGAIGPMANGNARGSAGQWLMNVKEYDARGHLLLAELVPALGWTHDTVRQFLDVWDRWHLNDMRAGCEHQRAAKWGEEEIELVWYGLTHEAMRARDEARDIAARAAARGEVATLTAQQRALLGLVRWFAEVTTPPDADSPLSGCYEVKKREKKRASWVPVGDDARGVLSKPCPTCGYKFGSSWLREEVPADVLGFLQSLPEADKRPAWV